MWIASIAAAVALTAVSAQAQPPVPNDGREVFPAAYFATFHPITALDMVQHVPGFVFSAGDSTLRGLAQASGNVVIDGRRLAGKDFTLDQMLQHIPADQVERIELIRGSDASIDMLGQPLVVNVVRGSKRSASGAVTLSNGLYLDGRLIPGVTLEGTRRLAGGRTLSGSVSLSRYVEVNKGDGDRTRIGPDGATLDHADVHARAGGTTGYAQAALDSPFAGGQLRLDGTATWTDYRDRQLDAPIASLTPPTIFNEDLGGLGSGQASMEGGAHFSSGIAAGVSQETNLLIRRGWKTYSSHLASGSNTQTFEESDRTREAILRSKINYQVTRSLSAVASGELTSNRLNTTSALTYEGFPIPLPGSDAIITETRYDLGGDLTWKTTTSLQLAAGLHAERSQVRARSDEPQRHGYPFLKPVARLTYSPSKRSQVRLRVEREVGQLQFSDFIAAAALDRGAVSTSNAAISPQHQWVIEGAYDYRTSGGSAFSITYGHGWERDAVDWVPVPGVDGTAPTFDARANIGSARQDKAVFTANLPLKGVRIPGGQLDISATWTRLRVIDPITGTTRQASDLKPLLLTAKFQQDIPSRHLTWGAAYESPWRTRGFRYNEIDLERATSELDLFVDYHPRADISLRLDAKDVLRRDYGRNLTEYAGLRSPEALLYNDGRVLRSGPLVSLRVRKAF